MIAVGDCDHAEVERLAADAFDGWRGRRRRGPPARQPAGASTHRRSGARLVVVARPGAPQSELRIGHVAVARSTPDYHALVAANMVLGGQFVSRINLNLREDKGLTYGARTSFDFRRLPGPFALQVSVQTAATARAIEESIGEIAAIRGPRPVTDDELVARHRRADAGLRAQLRDGRAGGPGRDADCALRSARTTTSCNSCRASSASRTDEVTRAAAEHLHPERLLTLVVGDLDVIGKDLEQLGLGQPVVLSAESL